MILKQVVKYTNANAIEATWVDQFITPAVGVEGEEGYAPEVATEIERLCKAYADVQMQMFRNDVATYGGDINEYENLIAEVEAGIVPPAPPTPQEVEAEIVAGTQERLDSFARTRNYDSILSACTYASDPIERFAIEGQYCVDARGQTWAKLYEILAEVEAGLRPMPNGYADIEPDLPPLVWPDAPLETT
jgi:hypothetical protein